MTGSMDAKIKIHTEQDPLREFDAHVYYHLSDRNEADVLRDKFVRVFESREIRVGNLIDRPVGPHPLPMFEINFKKIHFENIKMWLSLNREDHTVLIHEVTGNDPLDHTAGATWLGSPVLLDFNRLDPSPITESSAQPNGDM